MKKVTKKATAKMKKNIMNWNNQGQDRTNSKRNYTIAARPNIGPMSAQRIIKKVSRAYKSTKKSTTTVTAKTKQEEKVVQYLMETAMGVEIMDSVSPTAGKTNEMRQRYPSTIVQGIMEWKQNRRAKTRVCISCL